MAMDYSGVDARLPVSAGLVAGISVDDSPPRDVAPAQQI